MEILLSLLLASTVALAVLIVKVVGTFRRYRRLREKLVIRRQRTVDLFRQDKAEHAAEVRAALPKPRTGQRSKYENTNRSPVT